MLSGSGTCKATPKRHTRAAAKKTRHHPAKDRAKTAAKTKHKPVRHHRTKAAHRTRTRHTGKPKSKGCS
jgi:hypothetical protein